MTPSEELQGPEQAACTLAGGVSGLMETNPVDDDGDMLVVEGDFAEQQGVASSPSGKSHLDNFNETLEAHGEAIGQDTAFVRESEDLEANVIPVSSRGEHEEEICAEAPQRADPKERRFSNSSMELARNIKVGEKTVPLIPEQKFARKRRKTNSPFQKWGGHIILLLSLVAGGLLVYLWVDTKWCGRIGPETLPDNVVLNTCNAILKDGDTCELACKEQHTPDVPDTFFKVKCDHGKMLSKVMKSKSPVCDPNPGDCLVFTEPDDPVNGIGTMFFYKSRFHLGQYDLTFKSRTMSMVAFGAPDTLDSCFCNFPEHDDCAIRWSPGDEEASFDVCRERKKDHIKAKIKSAWFSPTSTPDKGKLKGGIYGEDWICIDDNGDQIEDCELILSKAAETTVRVVDGDSFEDSFIAKVNIDPEKDLPDGDDEVEYRKVCQTLNRDGQFRLSDREARVQFIKILGGPTPPPKEESSIKQRFKRFKLWIR